MGLFAFAGRVAGRGCWPSRLSKEAQRRSPRRSKSTEKKLPAPDVLERRETVSDTFFVALQAAGASLLGGIAAEKARDPFGIKNLLDIPVSGAPTGVGVESVRSSWSAAMPPFVFLANGSPEDARSVSGVGLVSGFGVTNIQLLPDTAVDDTANRPILVGADAVALNSAVDAGLSDAIGTELPHPQVELRELMLPPPPSLAGTGSGDSVVTTDDVSPRIQSAVDASASTDAPLDTAPVHNHPFIPQPGPVATAQTTGPSIRASDAGLSTSGESTASPIPTPDASAATAVATVGTWTAGAGPADASPVPADGASAPQPSGVGCLLDGTHLGGAPGVGPISVPDDSSCSPPGPMSLSASDPLFVLNFNEGLVAAPGVVEFDKPGDTVELRSNVYGNTVQSYSWDYSQAPQIGCVAGASTYKLKFAWDTYSPGQNDPPYSTNSITLTATMTDSTTKSMTLTFKVAAGSNTCMSSGTSATWPAVLAPDKPLESQQLVASDSSTRPYAVSQESGVVYVAHSLPAYNPGMPALGLTYSSIAAERRPIFVGRYELDPSAAVPNTVSARLQFNGTWGSSKYYDTSPSTTKHNPGNILQISLQSDAGSLSTGRYDYTFETTANYSGSSTTTSSSGTVSIINEESSVFGEGWTLDILDRVHAVTGGVILNQGAGNSLWFAESGTSGGNTTYTTPAGDFSTLLKNNTSGEFTRTLKDGTAVKFNSSGYQTSFIDLNSNRVTFTYDGSNNISTITDQNSLLTTFSYSGSCGASAHVCTITDPANRTTSLTYNASGRLEKVTDPDGAIFTFTYDSGSGRMLTLLDPRSNTTSFSYNFAGRAGSITRPDSTTQSFTALQLQSLCDTGCTSGSPGTPLISAEAVADYTDPRINAWDYRLDWRGLGSTTQLTDPLGQTEAAGHMIVWHRDSNSLASQVTDRLYRDTGFTRDSKGNVTKITHPDGNNIQFEYNSNSQVTKQTDELGRVTTWTYDSTGNLTQITEADPDGAGSQTSPITTMTYDSQGRMETLKDARSNTTTFSFDSRDRVTQTTFPDDDAVSTNNPKVTFTYDSASNVATRIDERGNTTSFTYDGMNRLKTTTTPDRDGAGGLPAPITSYTYDNAGNLTQLKRPDPDDTGSLASPIFTFTYNSMNRLATQVDALSNTSTFVYDNDGNLTVATDPLSRTTTYTYNELNYRTVVTDPDPDGAGSLTSPITTFGYDAESELTSIRDPLNRIMTFTYTNRGWQQTLKDALSNSITFSYDAVGNPTSSQQPAGGGTQNYQFDALDRLTRAEDGVGNASTFTYDPVGNRTSTKNGLGHTTSLSYDARNRLVTVTQPDPDGAGPLTSPVTTMAYDLAGNRTVVTDPLSRAVTSAYDAANRVTSITQPDPDGAGSLTSPITTFTYDNLDRTTSLKDPVSNLTTWTYDAMDQVLTEINPLNKTVTSTYDAAGQLTTLLDRKNQRREFVYDNDGRLTQEKWCTTATGSCTTSRIFTYTYDSASQLTEVSETDSRYTFTYDNVGRTTGISTLASNMPTVRLTNVFDAAGNRTSVSDNLSTAGTISFTYDAAQRMTGAAMTVGASSGPEATFTYDAANRMTAMTRRVPPGGTQDPRIESTFGYDNTNRLTALTHTFQQTGSSPTTLATYTYAYDAASELTGETNADGTYTYSYDNTSQLTGVDASGGTCGATGCDESFGYDVNGNRTMTGYTTGTGNRLTSDGTWNYTYDDNGNMLTKTRISDSQKFEFAWDYRNRLTQVLLKNSGGTILQQTDYTYDAFSRRIIKTHDPDGPGPQSATTTKTMYDGRDFAANSYDDFDGSNALTMRYLYGPAVDFLLARNNGTVAWHLADHLGTTRDIANTSGTILDHISYSIFGKITNETSSTNGDRFKFTARESDSESSLFWYRSRPYDPGAGRFVAEDSMGFDAGDPNLYRYVNNDPSGGTDPLGNSPEDDLDPLIEWVLRTQCGGDTNCLRRWLITHPHFLEPTQPAPPDSRHGGISPPPSGPEYEAALRMREAHEDDIEKQRFDLMCFETAQAILAAAGGCANARFTPLPEVVVPQSSRAGMNITPRGKKIVIEENARSNAGKTICENCGVQTQPAKRHVKGVTPPGNETHVDHIEPRARGGAGEPVNGQVLCRECNLRKRDGNSPQ